MIVKTMIDFSSTSRLDMLPAREHPPTSKTEITPKVSSREIATTQTEVEVISTPTLTELESTVRNGLNILRRTFFEVALALSEIKKRKLYSLKGYSNYTAYCAEEWKLNKTYAYDLLKAAEVVTNLIPQIESFPQNFSAIAESLNYTLPQNESQCRQLSKIKDPKLQKQAWERVIASCVEGKITARAIERVVKQMQSTHKTKHYLNIPTKGTVIRIVGNNPDLKALSGCWGIVTQAHQYSCNAETCLGMAETIHPQYLMVLKEIEYDSAVIILNRVKKISHENDRINYTVRNLLQEIATLPIPKLNEWQELYLSATELKLKS